MFKFNMYEVVRLSRGGYTFDGCLGVIMGRSGTYVHSYYALPLHPDALAFMHGNTIPALESTSSEPPVTYLYRESEIDKLRPDVAPDIPLFDGQDYVAPDDEPKPEPDPDPEDIGPGMESELNCEIRSGGKRRPYNLKRLQTAFDGLQNKMEDMHENLDCTGIDCEDCPMGLNGGGCAVVNIDEMLAKCNGSKK